MPKNTDTKNTDPSSAFVASNDDHSYFSPGKVNTLNIATPGHNTTVSMRELCRKKAVSTVTSASAMNAETIDYEAACSTLKFGDNTSNKGRHFIACVGHFENVFSMNCKFVTELSEVQKAS